MSTRKVTAAMPRAERKEQLLDLALELLVMEGWDAVTMQRVAAAAGVGKPVVYRSYPSAPALLAALLLREQRRAEHDLDDVIPKMPVARDRSPLDVLIGSLADFVVAVQRHPHTWRLVLLPPEGTPGPVRKLVERRRAAVVKRTAGLVAWGLPLLDFDDPPDQELLARAIISAAQEQGRMVLEGAHTPDEILASARVLLGALGYD